jgi:hypothetical protein
MSESVAQLSILMKPGATASSRGVDGHHGIGVLVIADAGDPIAADGHVSDIRGIAAAVVDVVPSRISTS